MECRGGGRVRSGIEGAGRSLGGLILEGGAWCVLSGKWGAGAGRLVGLATGDLLVEARWG